MIPKIRFVYSWIYDEHWKALTKHIKWAPKKYPSEKEIKNYIKKIEILWQKEGPRILRAISDISGLKWKEKEIKVYVVGIAHSFSDPLTIPIYENKEWFIDTLTHELIHQIFIQNESKINKAWRYFLEKYKKVSFKAKIHIPLHAIHTKIYLNLLNKKRLKYNINMMIYYPDYKESWEIVNKEGYKNIIKEWRNRIR